MGGFEALYRLTSTRRSSHGVRRLLLILDGGGVVISERIFRGLITERNRGLSQRTVRSQRGRVTCLLLPCRTYVGKMDESRDFLSSLIN